MIKSPSSVTYALYNSGAYSYVALPRLVSVKLYCPTYRHIRYTDYSAKWTGTPDQIHNFALSFSIVGQQKTTPAESILLSLYLAHYAERFKRPRNSVVAV